MDAKHKARWERFRRRGKRKFILLSTLWFVAVSLVLHPILSVALFDDPFGMRMLVQAIMTGLMTGLIWGLLFWNIMVDRRSSK
ncbi:MAG: hypothetical protein AVDCRST_MAG93-2435 [uncultured Chloroflexia bacterium]|uniref:Uncharacterized protein n=1 Tax=uncultured Chloroflexia bacterium TaxID=1672391 RepID=A0A6J4IZQ2_9CHLR|nr:MAG: hypothetical protein AVDCRST_MAG93-2435 [uncultured Chloroflexia bacterium]